MKRGLLVVGKGNLPTDYPNTVWSFFHYPEHSCFRGTSRRILASCAIKQLFSVRRIKKDTYQVG